MMGVKFLAVALIADFFSHREFSFTLEGDIYLRYQSFGGQVGQDDFEEALKKRNSHKIDIGGMYNQELSKRDSLREFVPLKKEFVLDIDLTDYDDVRKCCDGAKVCECWKFIALTVKILDAALSADFGYKNILLDYSGRRGIHCWICAEFALDLESNAKRAILDYLTDMDRNGRRSSDDDRQEYNGVFIYWKEDPASGRVLEFRTFLRCKLQGHDLFAISSNVFPGPFMTTLTLKQLNLTGRLNQNVTGSCWGMMLDIYPIVGVLEGLQLRFSEQLRFTCDFYVLENEHYEALMFDYGTFRRFGWEGDNYKRHACLFKLGNGTVVDLACVKIKDELPPVARDCAFSPLYGFEINRSVDGRSLVM